MTSAAADVIAIVSVPTNLGVRPPSQALPGTAKAPEALREAGLHRRLLDRGTVDVGVLLPGYVDDDRSRSAGRIRNQSAIVAHAGRLASRSWSFGVWDACRSSSAGTAACSSP